MFGFHSAGAAEANLPFESSMFGWFLSIDDLDDQLDVLRRRRYGVIEMGAGRLVAVRFRPFPKMVWPWELWASGPWRHRRRGGNRLWLYFNQPRQAPNFLALKYMVSTRQASLASLFGALAVLDRIACLKQVDAIVSEVTNWRISPRLLDRLGWQRHTSSRWRRNYIKRFYGCYPDRSAVERYLPSPAAADGPPASKDVMPPVGQSAR
jgi:hypothetical protein